MEAGGCRNGAVALEEAAEPNAFNWTQTGLKYICVLRSINITMNTTFATCYSRGWSKCKSSKMCGAETGGSWLDIFQSLVVAAF